MAEKSGYGRKNGPGAVLRSSPVGLYSFQLVFSPARVATWCALEVPWGIYYRQRQHGRRMEAEPKNEARPFLHSAGQLPAGSQGQAKHDYPPHVW